MRLLELFCGGKSVSKVAKKYGFECVSVDILAKFEPDICCDILTLDYKSLGEFDVVWASPPCTEFSVAKTVGVRRLDEAMRLVDKAIEIISYLNPTYYMMENPVGLLRHYLPAECRETVSYCQYGFTYRKNTDLWTNIPFHPRRCVNGSLCLHKARYGIHASQCSKGEKYDKHGNVIKHIRGDMIMERSATIRLVDRYSIPERLLMDIFNTIVIPVRVRVRFGSKGTMRAPTV